MATDPSGTPYTTPLVSASSSNLTISARYTCAAPAALVFRNLRNVETWHDWNRFVPKVTIHYQPDDSDEREAMEYFNAYGRGQGPAAASDAVRRGSQQIGTRKGSLDAPRSSGNGNGNGNGMRKSADSTRSGDKHSRTLVALGGEPSVRLKDGTKMTFHCRMKLPAKMADYTEAALVVTEVSRPNDPINDDFSYDLTHTPTHTDAGRSGIYRICWATDSEKGYPKFMMQAQRVHEVIPMVKVSGDGRQVESCEIVTWECQKGPLAKVTKKIYGKYLQERFEEWVKGLGEYCESMVGPVDRRDFGSG